MFFKEKFHPFGQTIDRFTAPFESNRKIKFHMIERDAKLFGPPNEGNNMGVMDQRLGRDTAPIETNPAHFVFFHERDIKAKLGTPDGGNIPAGTRSQNNQIV